MFEIMEIVPEWMIDPALSALFTAFTIFLLFLLRQILEWKVAPHLVKYLSFLPTRGVELTKHIKISGRWDHIYKTENYNGAHSKVNNKSKKIYQFSKYVYSEFMADNEEYFLLGEVEGYSVTGIWRSKRDLSYHGSFQLLIFDKANMEGRWIGFSKKENRVRYGAWEWTKSAS